MVAVIATVLVLVVVAAALVVWFMFSTACVHGRFGVSGGMRNVTGIVVLSCDLLN